jgi:hypothetical protein
LHLSGLCPYIFVSESAMIPVRYRGQYTKLVSKGAKKAGADSRLGKQLETPAIDAHTSQKNVRGASYAVCSAAPGIVPGVPAGFIHLLNFGKNV